MSVPDELEAAKNATEGDAAGDVRRWLLESRAATFATLSVDPRCAGYPFCSIVPVALEAHGELLVQIASIAAHTKNIKADPRASLFVHERTDDAQAGWRVTLVGRMAPVSEAEHEEALARVLDRVPRALEYDATHDFSIWRLAVEQVRYIKSFGRIAWLDAAQCRRDPLGAGLADAAAGALAHLNADHADAMLQLCSGRYGFVPESAEAVGIDRTGLFVRARVPDRLVYFGFGREVDAAGLRQAVVDVVRRARAR